MPEALFLVEGTLRTREYMGDVRYEHITRLVRAYNIRRAEEKFIYHFTIKDPYGKDVSVENVTAHEEIC